MLILLLVTWVLFYGVKASVQTVARLRPATVSSASVRTPVGA